MRARTFRVCRRQREFFKRLLPQSQLLNHGPVPLEFVEFEVIEEFPARVEQSHKPDAGGIILPVSLEMLLERIYPPRQKSYLDFRRTCVLIMGFELNYCFCFRFFGNRHSVTSYLPFLFGFFALGSRLPLVLPS